MVQMKYRYDREIDRAERLALQIVLAVLYRHYYCRSVLHKVCCEIEEMMMVKRREQESEQAPPISVCRYSLFCNK